MGQRSPTDLTAAAWTLLAPLIPTAQPGGRPRTTDRREVVNAILYRLRRGCQWRMPCTRSMVDTGPPGRRFVRCSWTIARAKSIYSLYGKHSNQLSLHVKYYSHPPHPLA